MTEAERPSPTSIMGPKVLLMGPSGTGKTHSLGTLVEWADANRYEVFCLFTENGLESLLGYWTDPLPRGKGLTFDKIPACLHWHSALTKPLALKDLLSGSEAIARMSYEMLTKTIDSNRSQNNAFFKLLTAMQDFPDDRTGKKFGAVDDWKKEDRRIFVMDGLSEFANAIVKAVIGNKPTMAPPEYGTAQINLMNYLRLMTQGMASTFVLLAHVDRQTEELTGASKIMLRTIGKALAADVPQLFSDVLYSVREGDKWHWDTAAANVDIKTRSLPIQAKNPQDFRPIMDLWLRRQGNER